MHIAEQLTLVEPMCVGLEHAPFNAALLASAAAAFPGASLIFGGETEHVNAVRDIVTQARPTLPPRVRWEPMRVPPRRSDGRDRLRAAGALLDDVARAVGQNGRVAFCSVEPMSLWLAKRWLRRTPGDIRAVAVFHEALATLARPHWRSSKWWSLQAAIRAPHPRGLTYLVLGDHIMRALRSTHAALAARADAYEHPSLLGDLASAATPPAATARFGFVGGGREAKGLRAFVDIAERVTAQHPGAKFEIVGSVPTDVGRSLPAALEWSPTKLPLAEYADRIRGLSHVVWLGAPSHYRLVVSGSLVDCLALERPVICLAGPFADHLFDRLGAIGWRCPDLDAVCDQVAALASAPPPTMDLRAAHQLLAPEAHVEVLRRTLG